MYIPSVFAEHDSHKLHGFIEQHSFGLLISNCGGEPFATHLPFLFRKDVAPHGALIGHMARANPQWQTLADQTVLAIFSGPHAYISPNWYEAQNAVPTWNYTAVHAYGRARLVEDRESLLEILQASVAYYEAAQPQPWKFDPTSAYSEKLLTQIVGFQFEIERLEGKFKLSQNQPVERQVRVRRELQASERMEDKRVAELMCELSGNSTDAEI